MPAPQGYLDLSSFFEVDSFQAGISLKNFPADKSTDRAELARRLNLDPSRLSRPVQTHSSHVQLCKNPGPFPGTDGLVSTTLDIVLSIQVADCIPIFMADPKTKTFGLVHGGWRGISAGIGSNAVNVFRTNGSSPDRLMVLLGPSIQSCCFEVGPEVAKLFPRTCITSGEGNRSFLDLQKAVKDQLTECGLKAANIINSGRCTKCESEVFHSFRREGKKAGRMVAVAGWS